MVHAIHYNDMISRRVRYLTGHKTAYSILCWTLSHEKGAAYIYLSCSLREIDPDTAYVVLRGLRIRITWIPLYDIRIPLFSLYGIHMPLFPYMAIQPIVLGMALLWAAIDSLLSQGPIMWRHNDMTVIVTRHTCWRERDTQQRLNNANARRLLIDSL